MTTGGAEHPWSKLVLPLLAAGIVGMVGMQVKMLVDITALNGQVMTMKEMQNLTYSKNDAIADWRVQEQKDLTQSERMNTIGQRIMGLDDRITAMENSRRSTTTPRKK